MNPHLDRALLLLRQSRPELAERELRQALFVDPNEPFAHAFLSIALAEQDKLGPATEEAQAAIAAAPDLPLGHHALAVVLRRRNRLDEARAAANEAIRLDPGDAEHWSELAQIELGRRDWKATLDAAERGLAIDAEDVACTNLRAMALVKLGRRDEAGRTIDAALARDPDDPVTHANQGWTLLHAGEPRKAMEHFRESLRLDPTSDWAKAGIVEAMKARNPLYRWLLAYFLWMGRLSGRARWGIVIGLAFVPRVLRSFAKAYPNFEPFVLPIVGIYFAFVALTWIGDPLFNLLLRLDRFGRYVLSPDQVRSANLVGVCLLAAVVSLVVGFALGQPPLILGAVAAAFFVIPASAIFNSSAGWPRTTAVLLAGLLAMLALIATGLGLAGYPAAMTLFGVYLLGVFAMSWIANALVQAEPAK